MKTKHLLPAAMTLIFATACELVPAEQPDPDDIPIRIVSSVTKVSGDQFDDNDAVGIYAVNATAITRDSWKPGVLARSGNHLDNVRFTLSDYNTMEEIDYTVDCMKEIIKKLRSMSPQFKEYAKRMQL